MIAVTNDGFVLEDMTMDSQVVEGRRNPVDIPAGEVLHYSLVLDRRAVRVVQVETLAAVVVDMEQNAGER